MEDSNDFQNKLIEPIDSSELLEESDEYPLPLLEEADENEVEFIRRNLKPMGTTSLTIFVILNSLKDQYNLLKQQEGKGQQQITRSIQSRSVSLPTASRTVDPFLWWNERKNEFLIMSKLARKYLCMSATSDVYFLMLEII
nr:13840_t:CDS:2 [Entrophospora candida]